MCRDEVQRSPESRRGAGVGWGGCRTPPQPVTGSSAELAEELPHVTHQQAGYFHGGEVAAAVGLLLAGKLRLLGYLVDAVPNAAGYRLGSDRGSPNHGSTPGSKRVMAQIWPPVRVRT
jgi:hypothetical protein